MSLGPEVWGPPSWKFIHFVTLGYPDNPTFQDKKKYKQFFELISYVLPCNYCTKNFEKHLKQNPLTNNILNSRKKLVLWGIKMHNLVNKMNNSQVYTYEEALKLILNENSNQNKSSKYLYLMVIIFIAFVVYLSIKRYKK